MSGFDDRLRLYAEGDFVRLPTIERLRRMQREVRVLGYTLGLIQLGTGAWSQIDREAREQYNQATKQIPAYASAPGAAMVHGVSVRHVVCLRPAGYRLFCFAPWAPFSGPSTRPGERLWQWKHGELVPSNRASVPGVAYWHLSELNGRRVPMVPEYRPSQRALIHSQASDSLDMADADTANREPRRR